MRVRRRDVLTGMAIYAVGDTVAALLLGQFSPGRTAGMMLTGGTLYALEIPNYFRWIDRRAAGAETELVGSLRRTGWALLYFNPLWIARHLVLIRLFSGQWESITWGLLHTAAASWLVNVPLAVAGNYVIQAKLPLRLRFAGSAVFSGLMAVYYALSAHWFPA